MIAATANLRGRFTRARFACPRIAVSISPVSGGTVFCGLPRYYAEKKGHTVDVGSGSDLSFLFHRGQHQIKKKRSHPLLNNKFAPRSFSSITDKELNHKKKYKENNKVYDTGKEGDVSWWSYYQQLLQYRDLHGHCHVPTTRPKNRSKSHGKNNNNNQEYPPPPINPKLAQWVKEQRQRYKRGVQTNPFEQYHNQRNRQAPTTTRQKLTMDQYQALTTAGFEFSTKQAAWLARVHQIETFIQTEGHCNPSKKDPRKAIQSLARWLNRQRVAFKKLRFGTLEEAAHVSWLTEERIEILDAVDGFVWDASRVKPWEIWFDRYLEFVRVHGHGMVPDGLNLEEEEEEQREDWRQLLFWVNRQRKEAKILLQRQEEAREGQEELSESDDFISGNEDDLPSLSTTSPPLYALTPQRLKLLLENKFIIDVFEHTWTIRVHELEQFRNAHGHCDVPEAWEEQPSLGLWVANLRNSYKKWTIQQQQQQQQQQGSSHNEKRKKSELEWKDSGGTKLTQEKINQLEKMGFLWDVKEARWQEQFQEYKEQKLVHEAACHALDDEMNMVVHTLGVWSPSLKKKRFAAPTTWHERPKLGRWVNHQRKMYRKLWEQVKGSHVEDEDGKKKSEQGFPEHRLRALILEDFVWDIPEESWNTMFMDLVEYKRIHGHWPRGKGKGSKDKLGVWVARQRSMLLSMRFSDMPSTEDRNCQKDATSNEGRYEQETSPEQQDVKEMAKTVERKMTPFEVRKGHRAEALAEIGFFHER